MFKKKKTMFVIKALRCCWFCFHLATNFHASRKLKEINSSCSIFGTQADHKEDIGVNMEKVGCSLCLTGALKAFLNFLASLKKMQRSRGRPKNTCIGCVDKDARVLNIPKWQKVSTERAVFRRSLNAAMGPRAPQLRK
ncbi:hypothetical protein ACKWTF_009714 [Chironomus riparius]